MRNYFLANLDWKGTGGVVASPDNHTPGGSYIYHWARDGALSMHALQVRLALPNAYLSAVLGVNTNAVGLAERKSHDGGNDVEVCRLFRAVTSNGGGKQQEKRWLHG